MNTFTDAQALVSRDVVDLLERLGHENVSFESATPEEREAITALSADGSIVDAHERRTADARAHLAGLKEDATQLRVTVLTTLRATSRVTTVCRAITHVPLRQADDARNRRANGHLDRGTARCASSRKLRAHLLRW